MEVYLDYNSTSPIAPSIADAVAPFLGAEFGNPSSKFSPHGVRAKNAVENARNEVARFVGATPDEVVFTSGGTESIFASLVGVFRARPDKRHMIISDVEHPAVWETASFLRDLLGVECSVLPVDRNGIPELTQLAALIRPTTAVISCMVANNETGALLPVSEIVQLAAGRDVVVHTDGVQAAGKVPLSFTALGVDLMSLSGHKFGALKGAGVLVVRPGTAWTPVVRGGGQETGRRGGTEGVPGIVALGEAARVSRERIEQGGEERVREVRDSFERRLQASLPGVSINGAGAPRLPNTASLAFSGLLAPTLIGHLKERGITVSAGSACKAASVEPSHVLQAMGLTLLDCLGTVRFSFGPETSAGAVDYVVDQLCELVPVIREESQRELAGLLSSPVVSGA